MIAPFLCLLLACTDPPAAELVTRAYDLTAIIPAAPPQAAAIRVTPLRPGQDEASSDEHEVDMIGSDSILELLRNMSPEEWESAGRSTEVRGPNGTTLIVTAPEAVQQDVERFLTYLSGALASEISVRIDVYRAEPSRLASPAALIADGHSALEQSFHCQLRSGVPESRRALAMVPFVRDYDVELAEGSARHQDMIDHYPVGVACDVVADRGSNGAVLVTFVVRDSWEREKTDETPVVTHHDILADQAVLTVPSGGTIQRPKLGFATIAGSARLEPGQTTFAVAATQPTADGILVAITVEKAAPPVRTFATGTRELCLVDIGGELARGFRAPDMESWSFTTMPDSNGEPLEFALPALRAIGDASGAGDDANAAAERTTIPEGISYQLMSHWIACTGPKGATEPWIAALIQQLVRIPDHPPLVLDLTGSGNAPSGHLAIVPAAVGQAFVLAGTQTTWITSFEVDVANRASTTNPVVCALVDGVAAWLKNGELQVRGSLLDRETRSLVHHSDQTGTVDEPVFVKTWIDARIDAHGTGNAGRVEVGTLSLPENKRGTISVGPLPNG